MEDVTSNEETSIGRISSNEETSINRISSDPVLLSDTESTQSELNSSIKYCSVSWARGRAQDMKSHLALKCKGKVPKEVRLKILQDIQSKDEHVQSGTSTLKKRKSNNSILPLDAYYNPKEAIDEAKETRANKALIK
ncbi:25627_t:CDS:2 [Dentiscutata erythropus]|uniref:25627_t:CDS:1 n=1 Tax=Dentiscutata erythropus TaxID=1348616 RepID=A0A9N8WDP6_9GLOM|nr:25627_t:CDS:2 [Dentiscutata erythropus]